MENPSRKYSDKAVVFDLGGVLIDWNPRHLYRKIFADAIQMEWFLSNVCTQQWHEQVDAGCAPDEIEPPLLTRYPEYRREVLAFHERFVEMFGPPLDGMVRVLEALDAADVPLFAITNWGKDKPGEARSGRESREIPSPRAH